MSEQIIELDPRHIADTGQHQLERDRVEIDKDIAFWQKKLDTVAGNHEAAQAIAAEAIHALDAKWPFYGHKMLVTGTWYRPYQIGGLVPEVDFSEEQVMDVRPSDGFGVFSVSGRTRIGYTFALEYHEFNTATVRGQIALFAGALPEKISLDYISPPNLDGSFSPNKVQESLDRYKQFWEWYLENSNFFFAPHENQKKFINNFLDSANDVIGWPKNDILTSLSTKKAYLRTNTESPYGFTLLKPDEANEEIEIIGKIVGVSILEKDVIDAMPIRSVADFIDFDAGICLMVQLDDIGLSGIDPTENCLLVPYTSVGSMELDRA